MVDVVFILGEYYRNPIRAFEKVLNRLRIIGIVNEQGGLKGSHYQ